MREINRLVLGQFSGVWKEKNESVLIPIEIRTRLYRKEVILVSIVKMWKNIMEGMGLQMNKKSSNEARELIEI